MKVFPTSNLQSQVAKRFTWTVRSLQLLNQHLRECVAIDCWFRFQIKALGNDNTELVSDFRFKNSFALQNSKQPLLHPTCFFRHKKNGGLVKTIFLEKATPGNIVITFVFTQLGTERRKLLLSPRRMQHQCVFQMGWSYILSQPSWNTGPSGREALQQTVQADSYSKPCQARDWA